VTPSPPSSDWKVFDKDRIVEGWLAEDPPLSWVTEVLAWIRACRIAGPPADARSLGNDLHMAPVPGTRVSIEYLQVDYERLMILRKIRG
jgi:hypothetical protein